MFSQLAIKRMLASAIFKQLRTFVVVRDNSELVNQDARIVWASLISSLEVARYDCLPHHFSLMFQPLLSRVKIKKKSRFQLVFEHVIS